MKNLLYLYNKNTFLYFVLLVFGLSFSSCSQNNDLIGTYQRETKNPYNEKQSCIQLLDDGRFGWFKDCKDTEPDAAFGLWKVRKDSLILYAPKYDRNTRKGMEKKKQIVEDYLNGIVHEEDYYTEDHPELRAYIQRNGSSITLIHGEGKYTKQ